jgi:hypothetical protein
MYFGFAEMKSLKDLKGQGQNEPKTSVFPGLIWSIYNMLTKGGTGKVSQVVFGF